jgi:alpha-N-arabinofuranosidase
MERGVTKEPAYALYRLWAGHLGTRLATVSVDGPRLTFAGAGSVYPATGDIYVPSRSLGPVPTDGRFALGNLKPGVTAVGGTGGAIAVRLEGVTGNTYPQLAQIPAPKGAGACDYKVAFEARFAPDPGSASGQIGLLVGDARGYAATRSAIEIHGIGAEWKALGETYHAEHDATAINLQAHLDFGNAKVSGHLEIRDLRIEAISTSTFPAYPVLTACAMLSEDGKTLHLIVFNKSTGQDIPAHLNVAGFHAASARVWEVNGPSLGATTGVDETVHGAPLDVAAADMAHTFSAHSMTAIDFVAQTHP